MVLCELDIDSVSDSDFAPNAHAHIFEFLRQNLDFSATELTIASTPKRSIVRQQQHRDRGLAVSLHSTMCVVFGGSYSVVGWTMQLQQFGVH
jgi:hypothetical protein